MAHSAYPSRRQLLRVAICSIILTSLVAPILQAAVYDVTNTNDAGAGSLRQAVIDANGTPGVADTIVIDPALVGSTIALSSPLPALLENIAISGPPAGSTAITSATDIFTGGFAITKQSAGTLAFTGANTYSGGTTITNGAFQGNTTNLQGNIANNSEVVFDQAGTGTYAGNMSGSGTLTKQGLGTLILSGTNSYNGGTTVSAGTLQGNTTSLQGDITNNAAVTFDQTSTGTYSGDMSGSGSLTKQGVGTLILTGINSYSGGTTVTTGTLQGNTDSLQGDVTNNAAVTFNQSGAGTYAGNMSGSGSLTKQGTGALTMTGTNSYAGGTTVSGGTLQGDSASLQGNITNNATVVFDQAGAGTYAGNMGGSGTFTKQGIGTLTLTGNNSYSGGTTVDSGALRGNSSSLQGDIENDAEVIFDQAVAGTYSGSMSGSGSFTKLGAGTLTLAGNNSYAGGTTVSAGALQGNAASIQGNVTNNSQVVFDQVAPGTYSGTMSGNGTLTKQGAGTLTISGNNSYVGDTTVAAGQLTVSGSILGPVTVQTGATLSGTGQVGSLTNQGTVSPGGTTINALTVNGNYAQTGAATLQAQINAAGQSDGLNASGTATVDGALVVTGAGSFNAGTTYTILTATNGVTGTFSSTQFLFGNGAFADSELIYGSTDIQLLLLRNATMFASLAATPNQEAVATTIDALNPLANGDFAIAIDQLDLLGVPELQAALDQLTGEIYADLPAVQFENTTRYLSLVSERIRVNSCYSMACCSVDDDDDRFEKQPPWNTWVLGYGMGADVSGDGNAAGIDYTLMGTAVGVDSDLDEFTSFGVSYGFTPFLVDRNSDRVEAEAHQIGVYANRMFGTQYLLGVVAFGRNDFEATRQIAFDDIDRTAESVFSSGQFAFYVEAGSNRNLGRYLLQPLLGLQYVSISQDAFRETGADSLNLSIPKSTSESLRSAVEGRIARPYFTDWGSMVAPEVRARWMHEFLNDPQTLSPSFEDAEDDPFAIRGVTLGRDFLVFGAGITAELTPSISAFVNYDAQVSAREQAHGGNGGLKWVW